ncbi:FAD-dependent oxidoreductase [Roseimicrobium sp. ORNL1]|uniref:FAD-dependent oxidoreductase n=1 Tax=Roseimicrobium sp. ORNL1 TaxID=2711231 RepID=UPI0013E12A20|nr:FAD-dependent oxidoreductase [Roseimicrobium sp. ORNL1]QIF05500.1 FAD-dependent oxidoreductase [Roseimicrobium sp. ORNL1]
MKRLHFLSLALPFLLLSLGLAKAPAANTLEADLLIIGGNESACAAAVQAARLGVKRIILVNDIGWLGGEFSAEGVGCLDEWTLVKGRHANFPRSGLFSEVVQRIRAHNSAKYGIASPGNAFCGTETIEPAAAAKIFEELVEPYVKSGALRIERGWQPLKVMVEKGRVMGVEFERTTGGAETLAVQAKLTMDASDWGDVIRLSGAKYGAGPDLRSRFGEPSAPESFDDAAGSQEMNPISWCLVLRETGGKDETIPKPASYDPRSFAALDRIPPWVESDMGTGMYSPSGNSPYTHRRLVDRWHNGFAPGTEATFLNYPTQDYPLCQLPQRLVDALEKDEPGSSKKNFVNLTPHQRAIVFADIKEHALGMLYHLQTAVHDRVGDFPQSFRYMALTDEFGTADRLPPKPYVREGLRLEALYMMREQDIRAEDRQPEFAKVIPTDSVFGFQFNIDFHPTRRKFLTEDRNGPWQNVHTPSRGWHTDTDRTAFPLRGLVPVEMKGLIGAGKNIGVSSVVQSALRLHGQMMHVGQAGATLAWMCLRDGVEPRDIAGDMAKVRELQLKLVRGCGGPGLLLWPFHGLNPDETCFEAVNMLAVRGILVPEGMDLHFGQDDPMTRRELVRLLVRTCRACVDAKDWPSLPPDMKSRFLDVNTGDTELPAFESMFAWGDFDLSKQRFQPNAVASWNTLHDWLTRLGFPSPKGLLKSKDADQPLYRGECAQFIWKILQQRGEWLPEKGTWLSADGDEDGDGMKNLEDAMPFDANNNRVPDRIEMR